MKRDVVVFDLGNVLIRWDPRNLYRSLFQGKDQEMEWFLTHVCHAAWNEKHDAGQPFAVGIRERSEAFPAHAHLIEAYFARWPEMLGGAIGENVAILTDLKALKIPVYALTNWSHETFPFAKNRFSFLQLFDGVVMSGEERLVKPDPEFYNILFTRYDINPQRCVFIDDAPRNIETAKDMGMATVHYTGETDVRRALIAAGIPL
jgi:2-haloacid dehalogenase